MANSPPPIRSRDMQVTTPSVMLADAIAYGYALLILWVILFQDVKLSTWSAIVVFCLFISLLAIAHELRKEVRESSIKKMRRRAALLSESPSRWSVEQRDGFGRRVDTDA